MQNMRLLEKKLVKILLYLIVFLLSLYAFLQAMPKVAFAADESQWIHTSTYFDILRKQGRHSDEWNENYWTLTQPPMPRYVIGFSRLLFGYESKDLNRPWDFTYSDEQNIADGCMPSEGLLLISRFPMSVLAALTSTMIFALLLDGGGLFAASIFVILFIFNDYLKVIMNRAMGDPAFVFFMILTALLTSFAFVALKKIDVLREPRKFRWVYVLFFLSGLSCGWTGASKINGLLISVSIAALIFIQVMFFTPEWDRQTRFEVIVRAVFVTAIGVLMGFILLNPYLYPNPIYRIGRMFKFRFQEMAVQFAQFPDQRFDTLTQKIPVLFNELFAKWMTFSFPGAQFIYFALTIIGAVHVVKQFFAWNRKGVGSSAVFVLVIILLPLAIAGYTSPLNWARYFISGVLLNLVCIPMAFPEIYSWIKKKKVIHGDQ